MGDLFWIGFIIFLVSVPFLSIAYRIYRWAIGKPVPYVPMKDKDCDEWSKDWGEGEYFYPGGNGYTEKN